MAKSNPNDLEYLLRRYNKLILKWTSEGFENLHEIQNKLTSFLVRFGTYFEQSENYLSKFFNFLERVPLPILQEALAQSQFESKAWIREELENLKLPPLGNTLILGGWIGLLGPFLLPKNRFAIEKLFSLDIDPECVFYADLLNTIWVEKNWQFKAFQADASQINFDKIKIETKQEIHNKVESVIAEMGPINTIINTSCEHFSLDSWLPRVLPETTLILQSNNFSEGHHHNHCHENLEQFVEETRLQKIYFQGEKTLPLFSRFLIIGIK